MAFRDGNKQFPSVGATKDMSPTVRSKLTKQNGDIRDTDDYLRNLIEFFSMNILNEQRQFSPYLLSGILKHGATDCK